MSLDQETSDSLPARLVVRRRAATLVFFAVLVAELVWPIGTWPAERISTAFYLYKLGWLAAALLLLAFALELFRFARAAGGVNYALGYTLLAVVTTPLIGPYVVPRLIVDDIAGGQAAWRRERAPGLRESVLRVALYFLALIAFAVPLWLLEPRLTLAAPVLALFLQRLVLPWVRRPSAS